jgi:uncharacterized YccA/Bax inhibitor family protein
MDLFKSGNPALSDKRFRDTIIEDAVVIDENAMTVKGTLNKFGFLALMTIGTAYYAWHQVALGGDAWSLMLLGIFGGLGVAIAIMIKKEWSPYLAPAYALLEGLFVGGFSAYYEYQVPSAQNAYLGGHSGIVLQAVGLTFAVVVAMYLLFTFKIIRATEKFRAIVVTATAGIAIFYLACWLIGMFGVAAPSFIFQSSPIGIGFSVLMVAVASLNLILDFDMIEQGAKVGAPKYMEWYGAFGLLVTIVWLYMEMLRLIAKFSRR